MALWSFWGKRKGGIVPVATRDWAMLLNALSLDIERSIRRVCGRGYTTLSIAAAIL